MIVSFNEDCVIQVIEYYDEETDEPVGDIEEFQTGEEVEWDIVDDNDDTVNIQFPEGSVAFGIRKNSFTVICDDD